MSVTEPVTRIKAVTMKSLLVVKTEYCVLVMSSSYTGASATLAKPYCFDLNMYVMC